MCVANFYGAEFQIEDSGKLTKLFELVTEDTECKVIITHYIRTMKLLSCLFEQSACFVKCFNPDTFRGGSEEIVESWEIEEQGKRPIIVLVNGKSERINYNMFGSYRVIVFDDPNQDICYRHFISQRTVGKTIFLYTIDLDGLDVTEEDELSESALSTLKNVGNENSLMGLDVKRE